LGLEWNHGNGVRLDAICAIQKMILKFLLIFMTVGVVTATISSRPAHGQDVSFNTKVVKFTISEISQKGPTRDIASFIARSTDLFWPNRDELFKATKPYLDSADTSKTSAAVEILYRLRAFHPMAGFGFSEEAWQKENAGFFSDLDAAIFPKLDQLLTTDDDVQRNLALFLGTSRLPAAKPALLQLAKNPKVAGQALICLGWHKDPKDMDDLLPFMLHSGQEASALPYVFRNSYGTAALPYLRQAVAEATNPFVRLQSAFQLIHLNDKTGVKYLYEAVLHRNELPNGPTQAQEIRQFATDYMGYPRDSRDVDDLLNFLKGKL
jgi:HEAT repeat protein